MATLLALEEPIELELRLIGKEFDPFQMDLEWFGYELAIKTGRPGPDPLPEAGGAIGTSVRLQRHAARGEINRKDFASLLSGLDNLIEKGQELRFEPYDLNFYLEWKIETPHVYSIVTWFDMALSGRHPGSRFPAAHLGFRFLADQDSLADFRSGLETEFIGPSTGRVGTMPPPIN